MEGREDIHKGNYPRLIHNGFAISMQSKSTSALPVGFKLNVSDGKNKKKNESVDFSKLVVPSPGHCGSQTVQLHAAAWSLLNSVLINKPDDTHRVITTGELRFKMNI